MSPTDVPRFRLRRPFPRRDPSLRHQIVLNFINGTGMIGVTCNCLRQRNGTYQYLAERRTWESSECLEVYRQHLPKQA